MTDSHHCHHCGPYVAQRDFDPEGTLHEPDRSDDREQVIYEHELSKEQNQ